MSLSNGGNLTVHSVRGLTDQMSFPNAAIPHSEMLRSARIAKALEQLCARYPIDMIEFYDYCGPAYYFLGAHLESPPAISVRLHNTIEIIARKIRSEFSSERVVQFSAERQSMLAADLLLSPGKKFWSDEMLPLYPELTNSVVHTSPPIHRPVGRITYNPLSDDVAFYGRLSTFKGLDVFIKGAITALRSPEFSSWLGKFIIMGPEETVASSYSLDEMKDFIPEELIHRFEFTGRVSHDELMQRLESVAFACFGNRMESFCYAAHELHTAGVPLILSKTAAFEDHFRHGESALFFDTTPLDLSQKMIALAQDPAQRSALSNFGLKRAPDYLVDHYAGHIQTVRRLQQSMASEATVSVVILVNDDSTSLATTIASLDGMLGSVHVLRLDEDEGDFRFATMRWRLESTNGVRLDPLDTMSQDSILVLRAGDRVDRDWLSNAAKTIARKSIVGAVSGWLTDGPNLLMQDTCLVPESAGIREPGLRTLIRSASNQLLQDVLLIRNGVSESTLLLEQRSRGRVLISLPQQACDITGAIALPSPPRELALRHDFDRFGKDYLARLILDNDILSAEESSESNMLLSRSRAENGFVHLRAVLRGELGGQGGNEVLMLRIFPFPSQTPRSWRSVQFSGDWKVRQDPHGPVAGAMHTETGSAQMYLNDGSAIDVLKSPWSGGIEIVYAGKSVMIDLYSEKTEYVRLLFNGSMIEQRGIMEASQYGKSIKPTHKIKIPQHFTDTGCCKSIFLANTADDFEEWPAYRDINAHTTYYDVNALKHKPGEESALVFLLRETKAERLILSSRLPIGQPIASLLASLPASIKIGFALTTAPAEESVTTAVRMAEWFNLLVRYMDRLEVIGPHNGKRDFFTRLGARCIDVPLLRPATLSVPALDNDAPLSVVLTDGELRPKNLMHMVNAILFAVDAGLNIDEVYVPSEFTDIHVFSDLRMPAEIKSYDDISSIAFVSQFNKRIAMGIYPQEDMPSDLRKLSSFGWLPISGCVSDLDGDPKLSESVNEYFWDNSEFISRKLIDVADKYKDLLSLFNSHAAELLAQGEAAIQSLLADAPPSLTSNNRKLEA